MRNKSTLGPVSPTGKARASATGAEGGNATGEVGQLLATFKNDQAASEYAKTELTYTSLVAPLDGVTGIRALDVAKHQSSDQYRPALVCGHPGQPISR